MNYVFDEEHQIGRVEVRQCDNPVTTFIGPGILMELTPDGLLAAIEIADLAEPINIKKWWCDSCEYRS